MVDRAYGVETIERGWRLDNDLPLQIDLQPKWEEIQKAKRNQVGIVLWMDGSHLNRKKVEAAIVEFDRRLDKLQEKQHFLGKNKDSFDVEL